MKRLYYFKPSLVYTLFLVFFNFPHIGFAQAPKMPASELKISSVDDMSCISLEDIYSNKEKVPELRTFQDLKLQVISEVTSHNSLGYEAANRTHLNRSISEYFKGRENSLINDLQFQVLDHPISSNTQQASRRDVGDYIVNTTDDTPDANISDAICADSNGNCSLRAAIQNANKLSDKNTIHFNISGSAPFTIALATTELPLIAYPVVIDGRMQTEYAIANSPVIEIDGTSLPLGSSGLKIYGFSDNSEVYGLSIGGFQRLDVSPYSGGMGIDVFSINNTIQSNYIGLKPDGTTLNPNQWGVYFFNSSNNTIGGIGDNEGNVISGNYSGGVTFDGIDSSNNVVQGNLLGTDATGLLPRGNRFNLQMLDAPNNTIGGNTAEARNIISAGVNSQSAATDGTGISITGSASANNTIIGNYIGTDITGNAPLANIRGGILVLFGANNNNFGGDQVGERNVISGNNYGIYFQGSPSGNPVSNNIISGNYIGINALGNLALPNTYGIMMLLGENTLNTIGGSSQGSRNIISGNTSDGVFLNSGGTNTVSNNYLGVDILGTSALPNGQAGVFVNSADNVIHANVISGNGAAGINLSSISTTNAVTGNFVGTNKDGVLAIPNERGIEIRGSANTIGGMDGLNRNIISGNTLYGVNIFGPSATGNMVKGNYIGTDINGMVPLPNSTGLRISEASSNIVGGSVISERNIISGNSTEGILISSALSTNNQILGNYIGTDETGSNALPNFRGMRLVNTSNNMIGGSGPNEGNLVSGNQSDGVLLLITSANTLFGNKIGVKADGLTALPNGQTGVQVLNGSTDNIIGGLNSGEGNTVAFNTNKGVNLLKINAGGYPDIEPTGNIISGNSIFGNTSTVSSNGITGAGIDLNSDGVSLNDADDADLRANNTQNYPVIETDGASVEENVITVSYMILSTAANSSYPIQVEFFIDDNNRQGKEFLFVDTYTETDFNSALNKTISMAIPSGSTFVAEQKILAIAIDANGNTSECSISETVIDESLSVESQMFTEVSIYPNPATDILNIKIPNTINSIELYSILGKKVFQTSSTIDQIDVSSYQSGIYLLKIKTNQGSVTKKIVIK